MYEIERRWLVTGNLHDILSPEEAMNCPMPEHSRCVLPLQQIRQVYMPGTGDWTIRFRKAEGIDHRGTRHASDPLDKLPRLFTRHGLTLKRRENRGVSIEVERPVTPEEYEFATTVAEHTPLRKLRWELPHRPGFVLDRFLNPQLENLMIAEVELPTLDHPVELPPWLGEEITGQVDWSNASLAKFRLRR